MVKTSPDAHEQCRSNGAADGDQLNLTIIEMTLQVVDVVGHHAIGEFCRSRRIVGIATLFGVGLLEKSHDANLYAGSAWLQADREKARPHAKATGNHNLEEYQATRGRVCQVEGLKSDIGNQHQQNIKQGLNATTLVSISHCGTKASCDAQTAQGN